jgi:hypothetical protein
VAAAGAQQIALARAVGGRREGNDGVVAQRLRRIGHHALEVQRRHAPKPLARLAGAERAVEGEERGHGFGEAAPAAVAGESLAEAGALARLGHQHEPPRAAGEAGRHGLGEPRAPFPAVQAQAVDEHQPPFAPQAAQGADPHFGDVHDSPLRVEQARPALGGEPLAQIREAPPLRKRRPQRGALALPAPEDPTRYRLHRARLDGAVAVGAAGLADLGEEQAQVVQDLGGRADGGAGVGGPVALLDGDGRREVRDRVVESETT